MRQKQKHISDFFPSDSPSPVKRRGLVSKVQVVIPDDDDDESDLDEIILEPSRKVQGKDRQDAVVIEISDGSEVDGNDASPQRRNTTTTRRVSRRRIRSPSAVISQTRSQASEDEDRSPIKGKGPRTRTLPGSDEDSDDCTPKTKKRRLRLRNDSNDDLLEELDDDKIIEERLRKPKLSAFSKNLQRLKRRKQGLADLVSSEDDSDEDVEASGFVPFEGARPDADGDEGELNYEDSLTLEDDFIVADDPNASREVIELPAMFSMDSHQDLSHQFKIICQLFVHLVCQQPAQRGDHFVLCLKKQYFSSPLQQMRRKLSGLRDSLVASSVWQPRFKRALETYPLFHVHNLDFAGPVCDACRIGGRVSTICGRLKGKKYDKESFADLSDDEDSQSSDDEEEPSSTQEFLLGRFCARRAQVFHDFTHWEYALFVSLLTEVALLDSDTRAAKAGRKFSRLTRSGAVERPGSIEDPDEVMDWLDKNGVVADEWDKIKQMMSRAHKLDMIKGKED